MKTILRWLLIVAGTVSLVFGVIGIFIPLLPTTPLLLLASICYIRSSKRLYNWLINNKWFGAYIRSFRSGEGIPIKAKVTAIIMIWLSFGASTVLVVDILFVQILFVLLASFFTVLLLNMKTAKKKPTSTTLTPTDKHTSQ